MDDDDDFFDTISVGSGVSKRRFDNKDYLSLSRNTVYQSAVDLENMELTRLDHPEDGNSQNKVSRNRDVKTYKQWRDRRWRYFTNGELCVDFVLAYDKEGKPEDIAKREHFEANLQNVGLILEKEESQRIHFVKIHVPREVLCQYAEILKLRLPIRYDENLPEIGNVFYSTLNKLLDCLRVRLDPEIFPPKKYRLTAEFNREKNYLFDVDDPDFFNEAVRITVASYILEREKFGIEDQEKGVHRLISEGIYKAAYPLHDGDLHEKNSKRVKLLKHWAQVSKCVKYQPLDDVKEYFGIKFALYFAWLGFYTHMLIPASIVGILCLVYAATTLPQDTLCKDLCNSDIIMCPRCDRVCDYWKLNEGCLYAKIQHFIDNPATIFFAVFMSFWSILYLELWKRYSAGITHRWGLTGFDLKAEPPRPEYLIRLADAKKRKLNVITNLNEPAVSFWKVKLPSIILSFTLALLWVFIAVFVVFGVVIYRMSLITSEVLYEDKVTYRIYILPITAAIINLVCILILNILYERLAVWLTEMELQRTQTEYDDSLALKIYMFQFVNYYSSIFYIAFLKGQFVGYPAKYNRIFGFRQEECNPGGCLMELTIQLAIIMIGKQAINAVAEMVVPLLKKMYNSVKVSMGIQEAPPDQIGIISCNQWTEDYKLLDLQSQSLFSEYLEMVLQYGFVTIFVTAFPLAPLFALINNILEMRLDAKKFIKYFRRPVPQRVSNIGIWFPIMGILGRISVVSNAFIIAFSSHFIPKLVYMMEVNPDHTEDGFLNSTLAYFDTADFEDGVAPENPSMNVSICRYAEYRNPPNVTNGIKYKRPLIYWHILAARLAFVVAYQNLVTFVVTAVEWTIPDIPRKLNDQIKREAYKTNETIIKHETDRAQTKHRKRKNRDSVLSSQTIYYDANGGFHSDIANTSRGEHIENS
ncbi:anoctamin-1-like isoform X1 [Tribolium madens]|uniref:anoctamin-1-like isoform X1 n=1 Tax=Tribolium madens TaxID=41895 RepID=UPI001CF73E5E|nr:anoctamin-1-like isoform X1 [Tribolium madens]XP_044253911.1 anoctamin-1-like isoform X1 [Tribolium madens]XP_044253912.1 anoctamin-1-like isoform X1 [Tribolium madens]